MKTFRLARPLSIALLISVLFSPLAFVPTKANNPAIQQISFAPDGGWVVLYGYSGFIARNIPQDALNALLLLSSDNYFLRSIQFDSKGNWVIFFADVGVAFSSGIDRDTVRRISSFIQQGFTYPSLAFNKDDEPLVTWWPNYFWSDWEDTAFEKIIHDELKELRERGSEINFVTLTSSKGWAIIYDGNGYVTSANFPEAVKKHIVEINNDGEPIKSIQVSQDYWSIVWGYNGWWIDSDAPADLIETLYNLTEE
jgi:hypothetical protein